MDRLPFDPYDFFGYLASGLLLLVAMQLVFGFPVVLGKEFKFVDLAVLVLAVYVAGQLIAGPAKAFLEDFVVDKILKRPNVNLFRIKRPWIRWMLFPGFYKPLPRGTQERIETRLTQEHGAVADGEERFLLVRYAPEIRDDERVTKKLDGFRDKYGFNRNLSFTSLLVGFGLLVKVRLTSDATLFNYATVALIVGVLLFYRYLKFFRQYSYEMFNCYAGGRGDK